MLEPLPQMKLQSLSMLNSTQGAPNAKLEPRYDSKHLISSYATSKITRISGVERHPRQALERHEFDTT